MGFSSQGFTLSLKFTPRVVQLFHLLKQGIGVNYVDETLDEEGGTIQDGRAESAGAFASRQADSK